ncbi:MAG: glyoxylate/hydroxypyruvate reductase A [Actinomycetota bacterium]
MLAPVEIVPYVRRADWPRHDALLRELRAAVALTSERSIRFVELDHLHDDERSDVRVAIVDGPAPEQLASLPGLQWVQSTWAGVEAIIADVPEHVRIARMIDPQLGHTMAEAVLAWTLYLHRDMPRYAAQQTAKEWIEQPLVRTSDRRVGVLGLGALGAVAATTLAQHGFDVAGWSRTPRAVSGVETHAGETGLAMLLERSDIVVNLLPDTPDTLGLLDARAFASMPDGVGLINFGRGPTVIDDDLLAALADGSVEHAVLDVFVTEPLPDGHPYWDHPRVTVLPHISGPTSPDTAAVIALDNVRTWLETGALPTDALVDRERGY